MIFREFVPFLFESLANREIQMFKFKLKNICIIPFLVLMLSFFNSAVYADPGKGHGQGKGHGLGHGKSHAHKYGQTNAAKPNKIKFVNNDRVIIGKYFKATPFPVQTLPPGIAKNLLRGKPLPPGIAKVFLPADLLPLLPVYPGYEYLVVGRDVVLVDSTSLIVADILSNVLR